MTISSQSSGSLPAQSRRSVSIPSVLVAAAFSLLLTACSSSDDSDDTSEASETAPLEATYLLTTSFQGDDRALSVDATTAGTETLRLTAADSGERQQWVFTSLDSGAFQITNVFVGNEFAIDVVNDGVADKIQLATTAGVNGQSWTITPLGNGFCRLTNDFTGSEIALDIRNEGNQDEPFLAPVGDFSGQFWRITNVANPALATNEVINLCVGL